jgi:hypothetical protein
MLPDLLHGDEKKVWGDAATKGTSMQPLQQRKI